MWSETRAKMQIFMSTIICKSAFFSLLDDNELFSFVSIFEKIKYVQNGGEKRVEKWQFVCRI